MQFHPVPLINENAESPSPPLYFQNSPRPLKYRISTPTSGGTSDEKKIFKKLLLHQTLRLEISGGPLRVKPAIQAHLGVENPEKHTFVQNTTQLLSSLFEIQ